MDGATALPEDFVWVIKTQDGLAAYKKAFEKLLGKKADGTYDDDAMDKGLKAVLDHMAKKDKARYEEALDRLEALRAKLDKIGKDSLVILGETVQQPVR